MRYLLDMFENNLPTALAAYNAGLGNVSRWLEDASYSADGSSLDLIPYKETDGYIEKTMKYIDDYNRYYEEL